MAKHVKKNEIRKGVKTLATSHPRMLHEYNKAYTLTNITSFK